ncbi:MAG: cytochrome c1 [Acidiferrobacterales bacterium]
MAAILFAGNISLAQAVTLTAPKYTFNKATVRNGALLFADHCSACHSVDSLRYARLGTDLGMPKAQIIKSIMLSSNASFLKGMRPTMTRTDAKTWFGIAPPDLSHIVRARGQRWVYTYLTSFYWDPKRPSGWNNRLVPEVAMPYVLAPWGGIYSKDGKVLHQGQLTPAAYHKEVADIVAFLRYASDPSYFKRHELAPYVLGVLILLSLLAYLLKKNYWRDVHG